MAEVTQDMILEYLVKKGGVVRNVDLVRHFKKYLQMESAQEKGEVIGHGPGLLHPAMPRHAYQGM